MTIATRRFEENDWPAVWAILEPVIRAGETYACDPAMTAGDVHRVWIETPLKTCVAEDESGAIVGTYYLKSNQSGPGSHVCNCGYLVAESARRLGVGAELCCHSQREALAWGFLAMQYNLVVSTNKTAVRLWQAQGFEIVGRLPLAFRHPQLGCVDALVMYKLLSD